MKCPAPEQLAEAVTTTDDAMLAHVAECAECQALLDGQREVHALLGALPDQPLTRDRRESLAAETLARADATATGHRAPPAEHGGRKRRPILFVGASLALAAAAVLAIYVAGRGHAEQPIAVAPPAPLTLPAPAPAPHVEPVPAPPPVAPVPAVLAPVPPPAVAKARIDGTGDYAREARGDRDVVTLTGGDVTVDSVGSRAVSVIHGDTSVTAKSAKAKVISKRGVIAQVTVFAGSVEVTVGNKRVVIEQGMTWDRNGSREDSLAAFRTGWEALRAGDNTAAIAAFDLATDDVVAEDALYWGAVASERLHDNAGAVTRYRALVERFPKSPRVPAAEAAIARLAP